MTDNRPHYFQPNWIEPTDRRIDCDVCIYGGTAAGVIAAVTVAAQGKSAVIIHPGTHLGGMTTGGLGLTDFGDKSVIQGRARQFHRDLGKYYGRDEEWLFEPHVAAKVLLGYLSATNIEVVRREFLHHAVVEHQRIQEIQMLSGLRVRARVFIDATYEGDLMAQAGVSYTVGRESNRVYGETINGVQIRDKHQFSSKVDPYIIPGRPSSGVLKGINEVNAAPQGSGDHRIQAYNFRICMCEDPANQIKWSAPEDYDPADYELARRWYNSDKDEYNEMILPNGDIRKFDRLSVQNKTDTNNHGAVSSDFIGANYHWPEANYAQREEIFQQHVRYQQGLYYFLANDSSIPSRYREAYSKWGLAKDEFKDTGGWPHQLYVREARRLVGEYVLTENDTQHRVAAPDPIAMGSYAMDSHNCQRVIINGGVINEGDVQLQPAGPYPVSYRCIVPRRTECSNLLVPVCASASHIAFGSLRMEPVFMALAEAAGKAASAAIDLASAIQDPRVRNR